VKARPEPFVKQRCPRGDSGGLVAWSSKFPGFSSSWPAAGVVFVGVSAGCGRCRSTRCPRFSPTYVELQRRRSACRPEEVEQNESRFPLEGRLLERRPGNRDEFVRSRWRALSFDRHGPSSAGTDLLQRRASSWPSGPERSREPCRRCRCPSRPRFAANRCPRPAALMMIGLALEPRVAPIDISLLARWTIRPRLLGRARRLERLQSGASASTNCRCRFDPRRAAAQRRARLAQVLARRATPQLVSPLSSSRRSTPAVERFLTLPISALQVRHVPADRDARWSVRRCRSRAWPAERLRLGDVATIREGNHASPMIGDAFVDGGSRS